MINLITGVPGSGKTVYALTFMKKMIEEGRPLYVHGIPNLQIEHTQVICDSPSCEVCPPPPIEPESYQLPEDFESYNATAKAILRNKKKNYAIKLKEYTRKLSEYLKLPRADNWHQWAPDGALIFYDEVQNVYRPRSSSSQVPPSVAAFETHRHKGLDFFLLTQSPLLFDGNIRRLIGKHIHLRPTWAGRYQYEFPECNDNPKNTTSGIKSKYRLNKKVFTLFKSSSLHTKQQKTIPLALYVMLLSFIIFGFLSVRISNRIDEKSQSYTEVVESKTEQQTINLVSSENENNERKLDRDRVANWAKLGVDKADFDMVPAACEIRSKTIKCPPYTIPRKYIQALTIDKMCIGSKLSCNLYFKIKNNA